MIKSKAEGVAFFVSDKGQIEEILVDQLSLFETPNRGKGKLFQNMIDEANRQKAYEFLLDVKTNRVSFDYQMNVSISGALKTIYFMGLSINDRILIIGGNNHHEVVEFANRFQQINNEQANLIRSLIKKQYEPLKNVEKDDFAIEEITK